MRGKPAIAARGIRPRSPKIWEFTFMQGGRGGADNFETEERIGRKNILVKDAQKFLLFIG